MALGHPELFSSCVVDMVLSMVLSMWCSQRLILAAKALVVRMPLCKSAGTVYASLTLTIQGSKSAGQQERWYCVCLSDPDHSGQQER
eukprot:1156549-Pelagomonas_calceolata.AAC.8